MCRIKSLHDNKMAARPIATLMRCVTRMLKTLATLLPTQPKTLNEFWTSFARWKATPKICASLI